MACWWSLHRDWFFTLATLGTASPWDKPKGWAIYTSGKFSFYESEIDGNFDEVEEQLYAIRNRL